VIEQHSNLVRPFDEFLRLYPLRSRNLDWFVGAGASFSSGIATAYDLVWRFKQSLYVSARRVPPEFVSDLGSSTTREELQGFIDTSGDLPEQGSPDEYAALFEKVYPDPADRRRFIAECIANASPALGPLALAALLKEGMSRMVWTTNFDGVVEDAFAKLYQRTSDLTVVSIDSASVAPTAIVQEQWPILVKLHGDFRSVKLKNTSDELREQDQELRKSLLGKLRSSGLIVAGYSGRDESIMNVLEEAVSTKGSFPSGLFWFVQRGSVPFPRVTEILALARQSGVDAALVEIENFDEAMLDIIRSALPLKKDLIDKVLLASETVSRAPYLSGSTNYPLVRLNALEIEQFPQDMLLIDCDIGGYKEVQQVIEGASVNAVAARSKHGVLALGHEDELAAAFQPYNIKKVSRRAIESHRLRYDSAERGLLRQAIGLSLERSLSLTRYRRRVADLFRPTHPASTEFADLLSCIPGALSGRVPKSQLLWFEGLEVRLEWANDLMWLLFEPRIVFEGMDADSKSTAADFAREKTARRYNAETDTLLSSWASLLWQRGRNFSFAGGEPSEDLSFVLSRRTAYSWRSAA